MLILKGATDIRTLGNEVNEKITNAKVVFLGNKLIKNEGGILNDRAGTLFAQSEIEKTKRKFGSKEIEEIVF